MSDLDLLATGLNGYADIECAFEGVPRQLRVHISGKYYLEEVTLFMAETTHGICISGMVGHVSEIDLVGLSQSITTALGPIGMFVDADGHVGLTSRLLVETTVEQAYAAVAFTGIAVEAAVSTIAGVVEDDENRDPEVIESGIYRVVDQIKPGVYRFSGYLARLDHRGAIIDNDNAGSGWGLMRVWDSDDLVEVSGACLPLSAMPVVDPIGERWRDGSYLVGVDVPHGRYRVVNPGGSAYVEIRDDRWNRITNDLGDTEVVIELTPEVHVVTISGLLQPFPAR